MTTPTLEYAETSLSNTFGPGEGILGRLSLNPQTSEPYYAQLKRQITALIATGELPAGSNLPSERVLAEALQVSRTTVKRCYNDLRNENQLSTHGRGGTQVQPPIHVRPALGKLKGFTEEMREQGMTASTHLVEHVQIQDRAIASIFGRPSTSTFLKLVRIRLADNVPMTREIAWYDLTLVPSMAQWDGIGSAYAFLRDQCGVTLAEAEQSIEAVLSQEDESAAFGFAEPSPCLLLKRKTMSATGKLAEYVEGTFRGDAYAYRLKLSA